MGIPQKRRPFGLLFCLQCFGELLHDELLGVGTSVHEVDTAVQAADVDAVGTGMAFLAHHLLTHDVVNHDLGIAAEGDVELVNGGVGEEGHVDVVADMVRSAVIECEQFGDVEGEAAVVVVGGISI